MTITVLVVDDDIAQVEALSCYLTGLGLTVVPAYDGLTATMQAAKISPNLICMDFDMPAASGATVYDRLRRIDKTAETPIIFISGISVFEFRRRIAPSSNIRFLLKPVDFMELKQYIEELVPAFRPALPPVAPPSPTPAPNEPLDLDAT